MNVYIYALIRVCVCVCGGKGRLPGIPGFAYAGETEETGLVAEECGRCKGNEMACGGVGALL